MGQQLWAISGNTYVPCAGAVKTLPAGQYRVDCSQSRGTFLVPHKCHDDDLIKLPDSTSQKVIEEIEKFKTLESHFKRNGFLWKRGILLWGPPGSGKTCTIRVIADNFVRTGGIALSVYVPELLQAGLQMIRAIEPERPILTLIEDIDSLIARFGESDFLALLDGENQINNIVHIATTNYPEKLPARLINRPSRFDLIAEIGMPSALARATYLSAKCQNLENEQDLLKWVKDTDKFSIAHLKELIVSVEVFQIDYEQSLNRLRAMMTGHSLFNNNSSQEHIDQSMTDQIVKIFRDSAKQRELAAS